MEEIRWLSAVEQGRLLQCGQLSATELRRSVTETIDRLNPVVNAVVVSLFDRCGTGVPILLKDAGQELAGTPHWVGVAALRDAGVTSRRSTALAQQLESAGYDFIGKGACPALSNGVTTEPPGFEPTRNPWDLSRSVGGSSGGSAAAVASGMVPVAHGSDATGSLRCPAALCGVATLNPTSGRIVSVAPAGQPPNSVWRDFVLARHAEDLTAMFRTLSGAVHPAGTKALRVGMLDHDPEVGLDVHPDCAEGVHVAGRLLEGLGHRVEMAWPPVLSRFWSEAADPLGVVSDATRPHVLRWLEHRLGRAVDTHELDRRFFEAVNRAASRSDEDVARRTSENRQSRWIPLGLVGRMGSARDPEHLSAGMASRVGVRVDANGNASGPVQPVGAARPLVASPLERRAVADRCAARWRARCRRDASGPRRRTPDCLRLGRFAPAHLLTSENLVASRLRT